MSAYKACCYQAASRDDTFRDDAAVIQQGEGRHGTCLFAPPVQNAHMSGCCTGVVMRGAGVGDLTISPLSGFFSLTRPFPLHLGVLCWCHGELGSGWRPHDCPPFPLQLQLAVLCWCQVPRSAWLGLLHPVQLAEAPSVLPLLPHFSPPLLQPCSWGSCAGAMAYWAGASSLCPAGCPSTSPRWGPAASLRYEHIPTPDRPLFLFSILTDSLTQV